MSWLTRYRTRLYLRHSLWIFPACGIAAALVSVSLLARYEQALSSHATISAKTLRALMGTIAASTFILVVLVSSALLLSVQLVGAQLTVLADSGDMQSGGSYNEIYEQDDEVQVSATS